MSHKERQSWKNGLCKSKSWCTVLKKLFVLWNAILNLTYLKTIPLRWNLRTAGPPRLKFVIYWNVRPFCVPFQESFNSCDNSKMCSYDTNKIMKVLPLCGYYCSLWNHWKWRHVICLNQQKEQVARCTFDDWTKWRFISISSSSRESLTSWFLLSCPRFENLRTNPDSVCRSKLRLISLNWICLRPSSFTLVIRRRPFIQGTDVQALWTLSIVIDDCCKAK